MTIRSAQEQLIAILSTIYDHRESVNIARMAMEKITGMNNTERLLAKDQLLNGKALAEWDRISGELSANRPIQYVIGEAWFFGLRFSVNENVLIPRPETEELVDWLLRDINPGMKQPVILDIGTGSGCIPIPIKKKLGNAIVYSIDISEAALSLAQQNANALEADIAFIQQDFLDEKKWSSLPICDLIISNPPYIAAAEKTTMAQHVTAFEPEIALFVPDTDPLIFYRKTALFAQTHLRKGGSIFFEINEALGNATMQLLEQLGYTVILRYDLQQRPRMIKASFA